MKANKVERTGRRSVYAIIALVTIAAIATGVLLGYEKLRAMWLEQCVVTNLNEQAEIVAGTMVKADVIAGEFGLKNGANLALIDFDERRKAILEKIPNLKAVSIARRMPDKVAIVTEERVPIARLDIRGSRSASGKVADSEGVVFMCQRGTRLLPVVREPVAPGTQPGRRLQGRARAALELIETCRDGELQELGILEVDTSSPDYLLATLGANYAKLKIAWEGMDQESTPASRTSLKRQLRHLVQAMRSRVGDDAVVWNATDFSKPGRIYADTKGKLK